MGIGIASYPLRPVGPRWRLLCKNGQARIEARVSADRRLGLALGYNWNNGRIPNDDHGQKRKCQVAPYSPMPLKASVAQGGGLANCSSHDSNIVLTEQTLIPLTQPSPSNGRFNRENLRWDVKAVAPRDFVEISACCSSEATNWMPVLLARSRSSRTNLVYIGFSCKTVFILQIVWPRTPYEQWKIQ